MDQTDRDAVGLGVLGDERLESSAVGGIRRGCRQGDGHENAAEREVAWNHEAPKGSAPLCDVLIRLLSASAGCVHHGPARWLLSRGRDPGDLWSIRLSGPKALTAHPEAYGASGRECHPRSFKLRQESWPSGSRLSAGEHASDAGFAPAFQPSPSPRPTSARSRAPSQAAAVPARTAPAALGWVAATPVRSPPHTRTCVRPPR